MEGGREKGRGEGERKGGYLMVIFLLTSGLKTNCIYTKLVDEVYMNTCCFNGNIAFHAGALNVVQHILAMIVHAFCVIYPADSRKTDGKIHMKYNVVLAFQYLCSDVFQFPEAFSKFQFTCMDNLEALMMHCLVNHSQFDGSHISIRMLL